jgi:hypothetical protein
VRRSVLLPAAALVAVPLGGCATTVTTVHQVAVPQIALPAGALAGLVLQPDQAPTGSVPLLRASGPASIAKIASFSADPTAAASALSTRGFTAGYVVEYADTTAGTSLEVTVVQFTTAAGAGAQLAADLSAPLPAGASRPALAPIGAASGAESQPLPGGTGGAELVTVRFRVGRLDYLVAATGPGSVDPASVGTVAATIAGRAAASPLSS